MSNEQRSVALITGAGTGIGAATAIRLAKHMRVVLAGRRPEPLAQTGAELGREGVDWLAIGGDVSSPQDRARIIDGTVDAFGRLDALVNNAAIGTCAPITALGEDQIVQLIDINLTAPILLTRQAIPHLEQTHGCVVSIGSRAAIDPFPGLGVYGCTKAGLEGLARAIRNEHPSVRAYTVHPGAVETDMLRSIVSTEALPTSQVLTPDDLAGAIEGFVLGQRDEPSGSAVVLAKS